MASQLDPLDLKGLLESKTKRWLHAGLYKYDGKTYDAYYSFILVENHEKPHLRLVYAADKCGTRFDRCHVGELRVDMITWNKHFRNKWGNFREGEGTGDWMERNKTRGKKSRKEVLVDAYFDPEFLDPFALGKPDRTDIEASVNRMFPPQEQIQANEPDPEDGQDESVQYAKLEMFLPGTKILASDSLINKYVYREVDWDPKKVITKFLKGDYSANSAPLAGLSKPIDHIESAFFKLGYRIDRAAAKEASRYARNGRCVLDSKAWKKALPYRLPKALVDVYGTLVRLVRQQVDEDRKNKMRDQLSKARGRRGLGGSNEDGSVGGSVKGSRTGSRSSSPSDMDMSEVPQRQLPDAYTSNTYFPGTRIVCDPAGIKLDVFKEHSRSASAVISDFISGAIVANIVRIPPRSSTLMQIESAFFKTGFRIDLGAALEASKEVNEGRAKSVLDVEAWQRFPPVKLNTDKFSRVDALLNGIDRLLHYDSDEDD
ncbi:hypothetical protein B0O99DRAFT_714694 [Bisporella sp. PMI_857]|nr:hypothetical protein B0O99DRAFT_714694 [Bisporella sp. PMI_857]